LPVPAAIDDDAAMHDASASFVRSPELLSRGDCRLLIVDVQEKLIPHISSARSMIESCRKLIRGAQVLGVPVTATEQYPQGLGATVPELAELLGERPEKLRFSSAEAVGWGTAAEQDDDRDKVIVAGIEAHVCVQQTVLDLLSLGWRVYVPADAVASRHEFDRKIALRRMADSGAVITTAEAVLFEICEVAGTPEFKEISRLVTGKS
jgi:nicotinamidase-related amidase